ncbi:hypothetical protein [Salinarimonas sp.]|uniref:baeRF3 domain-containing protein n=1 Tax=Salinarimonas sp. TaxID=2766526 RepID=UPI00391B1470
MLHLDPVTVEEVRRLDAERGAPCVSLYMPTQPATIPSWREDTLAFRELRRDTARRLEEAQADKRAAAAIDERLSALEDDPEFWRYMAHGLAVFATPDAVRTFRLPMQVGRRVEISDRFHVKPLAPILARPHDAYVLEMSQKRVRLLAVTEGDVSEVDVPDLPRSLDDFITSERTPEITDMAETQQSAEKKMRQEQFAHGIERALRPFLQNKSTPLVVAGVDTITTFFRHATHYPHLTKETISGNQEHTHDQEIAERARAIVASHEKERVEALIARAEALRNENRGSFDISEIARAAEEGRVEALVVCLDEAVYGTLEAGIGSFVPGAEASATTYDVLDELVGRTLRTGGTALAAPRGDLREGVKAAAVFRYAA